MKKETHFKLEYTKLNGTRAEKTFPSLERLWTALEKSKTANLGHDMAEVVTEFAVETAEPEVERPMSRVQLAMAREEARRERGFSFNGNYR